MGIVSRQIGKSVTRRATEGAAGSISGWFEAARGELPDLTLADLMGFAAHATVLGQPIGKETSVALGNGKHADSVIAANSFKTAMRSESGLAAGGASLTAFAAGIAGAGYVDWQLVAKPDPSVSRVELEVPAFRTREKKVVNHVLLDAARARLSSVLAYGVDVDVVDSMADVDALVAPTLLEKGWGAKPATFELDHLRDVPSWLNDHPMAMPAGSADRLNDALGKIETNGVTMRVQREPSGAAVLVVAAPPTTSITAAQRNFRAAARSLHLLIAELDDQPAVAAAVKHYLDAAIAGWIDHSAALRLFWDRDVPVPAVRLPLPQRFPVAVTVTGRLQSASGQSLLIDAAKRTLIFHRIWTSGLRASTRAANTVHTVRRFVLTKPADGQSSTWGRFTQVGDARPQIEVRAEQAGAWWWETAVRSRDVGDGTVSRTLVVRGLSQSASQVLYGTELLTMLRGFADAALAADPSAAVRVVRVAPAG